MQTRCIYAPRSAGAAVRVQCLRVGAGVLTEASYSGRENASPMSEAIYLALFDIAMT